MVRYVSLFSGVEAASVAWSRLGWEPLAFAEVDEFPSAVLACRFPNVPNLGDVCKIDWRKFHERHGAIDLIVGGSPCQSFSIAGGRKSLDGESRLMFEYIRALREIRPTWFLWENVPGVLNTRDDAFAQLLREVQNIGYGSIAWRVLDAQFFGVAQRRRRVFLVGCLGNSGAATAVLFEQDSVSGNTQSSKQKREELTGTVKERARASGFKYHQGANAGSIGYQEEQSPTLSTDHNPVVCLQTDHIGQNGTNVSVDICKTLDCASATPVVCVSDDQAHSAIDVEMSGSLKVGGGTPWIVKSYAMKVRGGADTYIKRDGTVGTAGKGALCDEEIAYTIAATQDQTIFDGTNDGYIVRRLTPKECERLQGFPDDWTKVPYRGKPAEECPDGPRYKACGNSMAVPVMKWIGERIQMCEEILEEVVKE